MSNDIVVNDWVTFLKCKWCNEFKEINKTNRYSHKQWFMWVRWKCIDCIKKYFSSETSLERSRIRDRRRYYENKKRRSYIFEKSTLHRKIKWYGNIHLKASRLIKKLWIRPDICPICWIYKDKSRIEAHHIDYNYWNKIIFCCSICHSKLDMWKIKPEDCNIIDLILDYNNNLC